MNGNNEEFDSPAFRKMLKILSGCHNLEEAQRKLGEMAEERKKEKAEQDKDDAGQTV